jgi:ferrous iron transport protein B
VAFLVYQVGTLITTGSFGAGFLGGLIAVLVFAGTIIAIIIRNRRALAAERKLGA